MKSEENFNENVATAMMEIKHSWFDFKAQQHSAVHECDATMFNRIPFAGHTIRPALIQYSAY